MGESLKGGNVPILSGNKDISKQQEIERRKVRIIIYEVVFTAVSKLLNICEVFLYRTG